MLIQEDLARSWAGESAFGPDVLRWTWFRQSFRIFLAAVPADSSGSLQPNGDALAKAFFDWSQLVEANASYAAFDRIDFLHFASGLLLQQLLSAQPPVLDRAMLSSASDQYASSPPWPQGTVLAGFVLTLLQAFRLHAGAAALTLVPEQLAQPHWSSFRENVAEDSKTAIAFLDQMCGLEPAWQSPTLIESRPAMQSAIALAKQKSPNPKS